MQSDIPDEPTHQPFTAENSYERLGWEGLSRSYSTGSHDLDRDYYYYTDGHATDGDDELSEKDFIMRKVPTTEDGSRFLQTNKTRMSRTPAGETSTRSDRYYSGFNGGRHADITFETILGEHSSAFGTERPNVLKKLASDGKPPTADHTHQVKLAQGRCFTTQQNQLHLKMADFNRPH